MRRLAVLHVALGGRNGGAERQDIALVSGLVRRGHRVVSLVRRGTPLERLAVEASAPVFPLQPGFPRGPAGILTWWSRRRVREITGSGSWDLVHFADAGSLPSAGALRPATAGDSARMVVTYRGPAGGRSAAAPAVLRSHHHRGGRIVTASEAIWSALVREGFDEDRLTVIHPGIPMERHAHRSAGREEARRELGLEEKDEAVGTVAVLDRSRGVDELVDAVAALRADRPAARLVVIGDGARRESLRARAARSCPGAVFTGWREDVPRLLPALDAYVFPGRGQEIFPVSLIEAMASGVPVVVCDQPGIREIIENGKQGLFVPGKGAGSMSKTIFRVLADREAGRALGRAGAVRVQRFSIRAMVDATEKLYFRMAGAGVPAGARW